MLSLLRTLLTDLFNLLDLVFSLEVSLFDLLDPIFILLFESLKFVHAHVHDILFGPRVGDHHAEVWGKLIEVNVSILTAVGAIHGSIIELLMSYSRVGVWIHILLLQVTQVIHAFLQTLEKVTTHVLRLPIVWMLT